MPRSTPRPFCSSCLTRPAEMSCALCVHDSPKCEDGFCNNAHCFRKHWDKEHAGDVHRCATHVLRSIPHFEFIIGYMYITRQLCCLLFLICCDDSRCGTLSGGSHTANTSKQNRMMDMKKWGAKDPLRVGFRVSRQLHVTGWLFKRTFQQQSQATAFMQVKRFF